MKRKILSVVMMVAVLFAGTSMLAAQDKVDLMTIFKALPQNMLQCIHDSVSGKDIESFIDVCDEKNHYLSFQDDLYGWKMRYWNLKDGKKLVIFCHPLGGQFYVYDKGKVSKTEKYGIRDMQKQIEKSTAFQGYENWVDYYPQQNGPLLSVIINELDYMAFKWQNEKFVYQSDYPKKNSTMDDLVQGFATALKARNAAACMQYVLPLYIYEQCMRILGGNIEQFICELIGGESEADGSSCYPSKISDIKNITYQYNNDTEGVPYRFYIELKDGRSYIYYPTFENAEIHKYINDMTEEVKYIPYITGGIG